MAFQIGDLWRWTGKVNRRTYAIVGLAGFAIKHNLDRFIAANFLRDNSTSGLGYWFNYWAPLGRAARLTHLSETESKFLATMLLVAMPFIWVGWP